MESHSSFKFAKKCLKICDWLKVVNSNENGSSLPLFPRELSASVKEKIIMMIIQAKNRKLKVAVEGKARLLMTIVSRNSKKSFMVFYCGCLRKEKKVESVQD